MRWVWRDRQWLDHAGSYSRASHNDVRSIQGWFLQVLMVLKNSYQWNEGSGGGGRPGLGGNIIYVGWDLFEISKCQYPCGSSTRASQTQESCVGQCATDQCIAFPSKSTLYCRLCNNRDGPCWASWINVKFVMWGCCRDTGEKGVALPISGLRSLQVLTGHNSHSTRELACPQ